MSDDTLTTLAPATHKQPSRKGKKAWRKNVDLDELQSNLEVVREEIVKGGVISEKSAADLFALDVFGDAEIEKQRLLRDGKKVLRADEILAQRSAIPGLDGRKKRKIEDVDVETASGKKQRNGKYVSHKDLQRLRRVAGSGPVLDGDSSVTHDPWAAQPVAELEQPQYDFLDPVRAKVAPKTLAKAPVPLTASGKPVPHVARPQGGRSYNPLVGDWSNLLQQEGATAIAAERERLATEKADEERQARWEVEAAKVDAAEKEGDDYATDYDSEWEGFQSEGEREVHTAKAKQRKTPAERNKIKARKEREAKELMERKQRERDIQEKRIKQIAKEVSTRDKARRPGTLVHQVESDDSSDADAGNDVQLSRRRFGKLEVPAAPLEVTLPEDLEDSLRRLKPEGNLLTDRYRNLLINGKLEVRKKVGQMKKKQVYAREKWTYKDFKLK